MIRNAEVGSFEKTRLSLNRLEDRTVPASAVLRWNDLMLDANALDHAGAFQQPGPTKTARAFAIVHAAIYDAVNSITHSYEPYLVELTAAPNASIDAAVAQAGHDTLVSLYPNFSATFDAALAQDLAAIPAGPRQAGVTVGQQVAAQIIASRANDGVDDIQQPYTPVNQPGHWQPDPLHPGQGALNSNMVALAPFTMVSAQQFRIPARSGIEQCRIHRGLQRSVPVGWRRNDHADSSHGRADGNRHLLGLRRSTRTWARHRGSTTKSHKSSRNKRATPKFRTPGSSLCSIWLRSMPALPVGKANTFTISGGPSRPFAKAPTMATPTRLAMPIGHRSGHRPTTATAPTSRPPFPAYASGHATFGAVVFRMIANFYGTDNIPFTFISDEFNGVTIDQNGQVRPVRPRSFPNAQPSFRRKWPEPHLPGHSLEL